MSYGAIARTGLQGIGDAAVNVPIAVLAEYANRTTDGKLNIMGIYDTIYGAELPVEIPSMRLVMQMQTEPHDRGTELLVRIRLDGPYGENLLPHPLQRLIVPEHLSPRVNYPQVVELNGVYVERFGDYVFIISVNEVEKARIPFHVVQRPPLQERTG
jgi:uncharacterized protein DUF6941